MLSPGDRAPDFSATDQSGKKLRLSDLTARGPVAVYFYPRAFTPGCAVETAAFQKAYARIRELGGELVGVSIDDAARSCAFASSMKAEFPMISDDGEHAVSKGFGVLRRFPFRASRRVTFVVGVDGKIAATFAHELRVTKHVSGVLKTLETIAKNK